MSRVDVYHGDSREILKVLADDSVDAVVGDPPYALVSIVQRFGADGAAPPRDSDVYSRSAAGFMGRRWDTGETAFAAEFWREVWRVLKPGGHVVAFSGTRTYHRLAVAIEDAGFEIRDMIVDLIASDTAVRQFVDTLSEAQQRAFVKCIDESRFGGMLAWIYGSGFPKSHDVERAASEHLCGEAGRHYARALPAEAERRPGDHVCARAGEFEGWGTALKPALEPICLARKPVVGTIARNVLAHGVGALNIDGCRVSTPEAWLASGASAGLESVNTFGDGLNNPGRSGGHARGRWPANLLHDGSAEVLAAFPDAPGALRPVTPGERSRRTKNTYGDFGRSDATAQPRGDAGSAARFFYSAKADDEDRLGSDHPTVKPVDVMAWLIRLVCPPGGVVLDPFAGSGTTGLAAMREGCDAILIEREKDHADDIRRRLAWARGEGGLTAQEVLRHDLARDPAKAAGADMPLFGGGQGRTGPSAGRSTEPSPATSHRANRNEAMNAVQREDVADV